MTNREKVRRAYLQTPTAFPGDIAKRTGLTKSQVKGARSGLVSDGILPPMYGFMGAMYQEEHGSNSYVDSSPGSDCGGGGGE